MTNLHQRGQRILPEFLAARAHEILRMLDEYRSQFGVEVFRHRPGGEFVNISVEDIETEFDRWYEVSLEVVSIVSPERVEDFAAHAERVRQALRNPFLDDNMKEFRDSMNRLSSLASAKQFALDIATGDLVRLFRDARQLIPLRRSQIILGIIGAMLGIAAAVWKWILGAPK